MDVLNIAIFRFLRAEKLINAKASVPNIGMITYLCRHMRKSDLKYVQTMHAPTRLRTCAGGLAHAYLIKITSEFCSAKKYVLASQIA